MSQPQRASMDLIQEDYDSKFRFVLLAAQRSEQLIKGARPRVDKISPKHAKIAMQEVLEKSIEWGYGPAPEKPVEDVEDE